jgi:hypothetical protein
VRKNRTKPYSKAAWACSGLNHNYHASQKNMSWSNTLAYLVANEEEGKFYSIDTRSPICHLKKDLRSLFKDVF